jgi:hypothetical protein
MTTSSLDVGTGRLIMEGVDRPVLAQETRFNGRLHIGHGLLAVRDMHDAVAGVAEIEGNYGQRSRAALEPAETSFDSRKCLAAPLSACER